MRWCPRCQRRRRETSFNKRKSKYRYQGWCRDCTLEYSRTYAPKKAAQRRQQYENMRAQVYALKAVPCADCKGVFPPYVMDFDHLPGVKKYRKVSNLMVSASPRTLTEIAKCDVVCSNCHRIRTHNRDPRRTWKPSPNVQVMT